MAPRQWRPVALAPSPLTLIPPPAYALRAAGNRAPIGIFIHAAWLIADPTREDQLSAFIQYALGKDNVVFATISEVGWLSSWARSFFQAAVVMLEEECHSAMQLFQLIQSGWLQRRHAAAWHARRGLERICMDSPPSFLSPSPASPPLPLPRGAGH